MLALLALPAVLGQGDGLGCAKDENGVVGVACKDYCECGHRACTVAPAKKLELATAGKSAATDRCYVHDPVKEAESDCGQDVRCCIPADECAPTCTLNQQNAITWLLKEIANVTTEECAAHFLGQVRGMTQNENDLCDCIHSSLDEIEQHGRPAVFTAAVDAIHDSQCRMTAGDDKTFHDITTKCMRTSVVGQPRLFVDDESIKFYLPPGEMVDLVTWESPSGQPVSLRGSIFQKEGSLTGSRDGNVQWFRRFELALANYTALSITSFHRMMPELAEPPPEDNKADRRAKRLADADEQKAADAESTPSSEAAWSHSEVKLESKHMPAAEMDAEAETREEAKAARRAARAAAADMEAAEEENADKFWRTSARAERHAEATAGVVTKEQEQADKFWRTSARAARVAAKEREEEKVGKFWSTSARAARAHERRMLEPSPSPEASASAAEEATEQAGVLARSATPTEVAAEQAVRERDEALARADKDRVAAEKARAEAEAAKLEEAAAIKERDAAVARADRERKDADEARAAAEKAKLKEEERRLKDEEKQRKYEEEKRRALQAGELPADDDTVTEQADVTVQSPPEAAEDQAAVPVMHHAGRWKLATRAPGGYGWIAASQEAPQEPASPPESAKVLRDTLKVQPAAEPDPSPTPSDGTAEDDQQAAETWAAFEELSAPGRTALSQKAAGAPTGDHSAVHAGISVAQAAAITEIPERVMHAAEAKLDELVVNKLEEMLASKVGLKLDEMLDSRLDELLGRQPTVQYRAARARASSSLLALQPTEKGDTDIGTFSPAKYLSLVSSEALRDPEFTAEHKRRQNFVGIRLDGKHIFPQPARDGTAPRTKTVYTSERAKELGLKVTAVETRENKIGDDMSIRLDVETTKMKFRIWSSKAQNFRDPELQAKYAHLNLNLLGPFPSHVGGFFAELRGRVPMSRRSKSFLRKADREGTSQKKIYLEAARDKRRA